MVILTYVFYGYQFKLPIYTTSQGDNLWGLGLSFGIFGVANLASYWQLQRKLSKKSIFEEVEYIVAMSNYQQRMTHMKNHLQNNAFQLKRIIDSERKNKGLIIIEAYYGLDEHIYLVDAGLLIYSVPQTAEQYYNCQLIPVKKTLQLMVEN